MAALALAVAGPVKGDEVDLTNCDWVVRPRTLNARFGIALTADDVTNLGKHILKTERAFNMAAGFTREDDRLPEFFYTEPLPPHNVVFDFTGEEIDTFWNF